MPDSWKITHGMSKTKINIVWLNMMNRCYSESNPHYKNYGGRGILVHDSWHDFLTFYRDIGDAPDKMQFDRIDNDRNYEPGNVRWVTAKENQRNKRTNRLVEIFGESKPMVAWEEDARCVVSWNTARMRINRGWSPERAITTPLIK